MFSISRNWGRIRGRVLGDVARQRVLSGETVAAARSVLVEAMARTWEEDLARAPDWRSWSYQRGVERRVLAALALE